MRQVNIQVLSGADTATVTGSQIDSNQLINASFHLVVGDATAAGTLLIQGSNDVCGVGQQSANFTVTNWATVSSTAQAAGTQQVMVSLANIPYRWMRAQWTKTTGGSSTVVVNMFAVGV